MHSDTGAALTVSGRFLVRLSAPPIAVPCLPPTVPLHRRSKYRLPDCATLRLPFLVSREVCSGVCRAVFGVRLGMLLAYDRVLAWLPLTDPSRRQTPEEAAPRGSRR